MNKEELIEIIKTEQINAEQLRQLDRLIDDYPWFGLPRFLRLKAMHQAGKDVDPAEVSRTVVFSSDRSYLYRWTRGEAGSLQGRVGETGSELEFIDDDDEMTGEEVSDIFDPAGMSNIEGDETGLMEDLIGTDDDGLDDGSVTDDDAHERAIPEKEETEMEEPEMEELEAIPVIDPLDDDDAYERAIPEKEEPEMEEGIDVDREEQKVKGEGGDSEGDEVAGAGAETSGYATEKGSSMDETVEQAAPSGKPERAPGRRSTAERYQEGSRKSTSGAANHSSSLIEQFLNSEPGVIKADKKTSLEGDVSVGSVQEDDSFITDTLAKIYVKQGLHAKAIYAYERLSLKYPEKSAYFAAQIEKIKNISII